METREILEKLHLGQINVKEAEMMINRTREAEIEKRVDHRVKELVDKLMASMPARKI